MTRPIRVLYLGEGYILWKRVWFKKQDLHYCGNESCNYDYPAVNVCLINCLIKYETYNNEQKRKEQLLCNFTTTIQWTTTKKKSVINKIKYSFVYIGPLRVMNWRESDAWLQEDAGLWGPTLSE